MTDTTYQGWTNWETWNAALWIGNDEFLYNTAKACVTYREGLETPWDKFVRCMWRGRLVVCSARQATAWHGMTLPSMQTR